MHAIMMRRAAAFLALFALGAVEAHAQTRSYPSLAKRPVENSDRLQEPAPATVEPAMPDASLVQTVISLAEKADAADAAFRNQIGLGRSSITAAIGAAPMSEPWVEAQMVISAADAARYESIASLAVLDTLHVARQDSDDSGRVAADMAAINPARARVLAMVDTQNDALDALRKDLKAP